MAQNGAVLQSPHQVGAPTALVPGRRGGQEFGGRSFERQILTLPRSARPDARISS